MQCDDPRATYFQPLAPTNIPCWPTVYQQPAVTIKAEPEARENAAIRFIKQIAIQDKSNHPQGSKIPSEEKLLTAVDLCHF